MITCNRISEVRPETHAKRQATQHGCLPSLLGDGDKRIKIMYGEGEKKFSTGQEPPRQNKNLLYRHNRPNEQTKKGAPFICTPWVPFHLSFNSQQGSALSRLSWYALLAFVWIGLSGFYGHWAKPLTTTQVRRKTCREAETIPIINSSFFLRVWLKPEIGIVLLIRRFDIAISIECVSPKIW